MHCLPTNGDECDQSDLGVCAFELQVLTAQAKFESASENSQNRS
jgi:hypothetical protein